MAFVGKYELVTMDKDTMEAYLKAVGVSAVLRKTALKVKPKIEITEKNGEYTFKTLSSFKNMEFKFTLGKEFADETPAFKKCKSTIVQDENKLIQVQTYTEKNAEVKLKITREFTDTNMTATFEGPENTISIAVYDRMKEGAGK